MPTMFPFRMATMTSGASFEPLLPPPLLPPPPSRPPPAAADADADAGAEESDFFSSAKNAANLRRFARRASSSSWSPAAPPSPRPFSPSSLASRSCAFMTVTALLHGLALTLQRTSTPGPACFNPEERAGAGRGKVSEYQNPQVIDVRVGLLYDMIWFYDRRKAAFVSFRRSFETTVGRTQRHGWHNLRPLACSYYRSTRSSRSAVHTHHRIHTADPSSASPPPCCRPTHSNTTPLQRASFVFFVKNLPREPPVLE